LNRRDRPYDATGPFPPSSSPFFPHFQRFQISKEETEERSKVRSPSNRLAFIEIAYVLGAQHFKNSNNLRQRDNKAAKVSP
jgi:hypothetical protein